MAPNQRLRDERERRGWSRLYVAERINLADPKTLGRWERGVSSPSRIFQRKLCALFGKSNEDLGFSLEKGTRKADKPHGNVLFWNIPAPRNPFFTGREEVLVSLHTTLHTDDKASTIRMLAIGGIGGIGKTQTALEYSYRFRHEYHAVLWLRAETDEAFLSDCRTLTRRLRLSFAGEEDVYELLKHWLRTHSRWLVVLDNLENMALLNTIFPFEGTGHVLLTTHLPSLGGVAQYITLNGLEPNEGQHFLLHRAGYNTTDKMICLAEREAAMTISSLVVGLPLALDQAGVYIEETGCSITDYLACYRQHSAILLDKRGKSSLDHPLSVSATFSLPYKKLEQSHPVAFELLSLCTFLYSDAIPEEIIFQALLEPDPTPQQKESKSLLFDETLSILRRLSLISRDPNTKMLSIHRLVQTVLKAGMGQQEQRKWAERVVHLLNRVLLTTDLSPVQRASQRYFLQIQTCMALISQWNMTSLEALQLLHSTPTTAST
ncbi:MAG TPA: helix-turn-helix transcriptional regulator [Ktedonobacteraceae bacterium]|nr:helix-turn-helix transcriptional regulator [Ktedonobacteraceae bacterium]